MPAPLFPVQPILLIDDDRDLLNNFAITLRNDGIGNLVLCDDSREAATLLREGEFELVMLDLNMPNVSGREILPMITQRLPDVPVIVITGVDEVDTAVRCMRAGAFDYMVKPVDADQLLTGIRRAIDVHEVRRENSLLKKSLLSTELSRPEAFKRIVTRNPSMHALFQYIEAIALTPQPILVTGETGVGKELVARAIHDVSGRQGSFVPVNIAGLDDNVFSDTLFGHVRGAFTGALEARKGLIDQAAGGTLFLDEIGDLNATSQVKLLRLVQEKEYFTLGSDTARRTTARIVVATNRDLQALQREGTFREDLYFRLRSHHVDVPPLRRRKDDLPLLLEHFLARAAHDMNKRKPTPPAELITLLRTHTFPGNVRELESMCFDAVSTHRGGVLSMDPFRAMIASERKDPPPDSEPLNEATDDPSACLVDAGMPLPSFKQAEAMLIDEALRRTDGNQSMAAQLLGITRQTLIRRLKLMRAETAR